MSATPTRRPAVAGTFYAADPDDLREDVDALLAAAGPRDPTPMTGVIVPHAGHIYSGPVAASAFRLLPADVERVVLIGPSHFVPLPTMAATAGRCWQTPLGDVPIDTDAVDMLAAHSSDSVVIDDLPHSREHCLEVQLPFLQRVLNPGWKLVPLVVGHLAEGAVALSLRRVLDAATLLVVSTDLSHYLPYDVAAAKDARTAMAVVARNPGGITDDDACGAYALRGALYYAATTGLVVRQIDLRSSGDTAGSRDRVVGYGSFVIDA